MLTDIVFPLSHAVRKSHPINPTEQQELAAHFELPVDRVVSALHEIVGRLERGELAAPKKAKSLRNLIREQIRINVCSPRKSMEEKIDLLNNNLNARYAVFRRSPSGRSAYFHRPIEKFDDALDAAREYAAESASRGHTDFTFYVVELKHRVGIEHGKLVDQANT